MCKRKTESTVNDLISKRLEGIEDVQASNFRDNQDVQAIFAAQLNELRTRLATCYEEIHDLSQDHLKDKIGVLNARLNDYGIKLSALTDRIKDLESFIVDDGGP